MARTPGMETVDNGKAVIIWNLTIERQLDL